MAETKSTGTLIYQWTAGGEAYRLIAVGRYYAGYEDAYLIEHRERDGIGDARWVSCAAWAPGDDGTQAQTILIGAVQTLLRETSGGLRLD